MLIRLAPARPPRTATFVGPVGGRARAESWQGRSGAHRGWRAEKGSGEVIASATSAALHLFWVMPVFFVSSGMDSKPITKT